jgi:hypothetical protein
MQVDALTRKLLSADMLVGYLLFAVLRLLHPICRSHTVSVLWQVLQGPARLQQSEEFSQCPAEYNASKACAG